MLDELFDIFGGGDDPPRRRPDGSRRQGGIRGFISRLMGSDDGEEAPIDERDARRRDRNDDDAPDSYERAGRRNRGDRDRDDDGWFDFSD